MSAQPVINNETLIRRILTTEVKYVIAIIVFVFGVVKPYFEIKQDIALIKENHLTHIEYIENQIKELKERDVERDKQIVELLKQLSSQK